LNEHLNEEDGTASSGWKASCRNGATHSIARAITE
jgi:hypothetical protein